MESSSGQGIQILVMGVVAGPLTGLGLFCGPALLLGPIFGILAIVQTVGLMGRINSGEVDDSGKIPAIIGAIFGALSIIGMILSVISIFGVVFLAVLFGN